MGVIKDLIIVGAGGFGREMLQWIHDINARSRTFRIKGFIDDNPRALDGYGLPYGVIGSIRDWSPSENEVFAMAIADPKAKEAVSAALKSRNARFTRIVHPEAHLGATVTLGEGVVIYPGARLTVDVTVGDFVTFLHSFAGHDVTIGDYATVFGSSSLNGFVTLGKGVLVSSHVAVVPRRRIGDHAFLGIGSVVVDNVKPGAKMFGNPARQMKL